MAENSENTAEETAPKPKKLPGRPFTTDSSKAVQRRAAEMRKVRKEMRQKLLETVYTEGLEKYMVKAIKTGDEKLMNIVVAASKLTGLDFAQSEDAVQRIDAKVNANVKADTTLKVTVEEV